MLIRKYLKENDGTAYLINSTEREVLINGYILDPNRIFTNDGAKRNLIKLNNSISKLELNKTIELISNDRDDFFKSISPPKGGLLIALHNNIREYSIDNEIPLSTEVSIKNTNHPVKILGRGDINVPLVVEANKFTSSARAKIEDAGGTVREIR